MKQFKKLSIDGKYVLVLTLILTAIGVYMVYSASRVWAFSKLGDSYYYLKRQLVFAAIGLGLLYLGMMINVETLKKNAKKLLIISFILLILVLIPGIGIVRGGSRSWFGFGSFAFQPAELFKIAMIIYGAKVLSINYRDSYLFLKKVFPIIFICMVGFGLIMLQPDFGTGLVLLAAIIVMTLISRAKVKVYIRLGLVGLSGLVGLVLSAPYRLARITAFINPWQDPLGSGFQIIQSLYAIGPGGIIGMGVDNSIQKYFYLPEPQTDFIFSIIAEEYGFIGGGFVIFLFIMLLFKGLNIAKKSDNHFSAFLAVGIVSLIGIQVIINLGVVVGLLPVTGITLPLISYGGSSLTIMLFSIGLLLGLSMEKEHE